MQSFSDWAARYPQASADLKALLVNVGSAPPGASEARAQQDARLDIRRQGAMSWRNNVGAMPAKVPTRCPACSFSFEIRQPPLRWGLCNDSHKLNTQFKSSDLILIISRLITPDMVGRTIGQFGSVEIKPPGWQYSGNAHERGQLAWLSLIQSFGGFATFSTGKVIL